MNEEKKEELSDLKINDKRRFNADGTEKANIPDPEKKPTEEKEPSRPEPKITQELPEISFVTLILSLAGSAQAALGIAPDPISRELKKDLNQAKQTIDLLGILEEKTKGNLQKEEAELLKVILADLRVRFIQEQKKA